MDEVAKNKSFLEKCIKNEKKKHSDIIIKTIVVVIIQLIGI